MGRLLVLEGLDGSGKATQAALLGGWLTRMGQEYKHISFPDYKEESSALVRLYLSGRLGTMAEVSPYGASLFFAVDRYASFLTGWKKDYDQGRLIVADRYATSNVAHQMSRLPRDQWDDYLRWQDDLEYDRVGLPRPDLVLYLDMEPEVSRMLLSRRYQGHEEKRDIHEADFQYLLSCRQAALYGAQKLGWQVISCSRDGAPHPPEVIAGLVRDAALPLMQAKC